MLIEIKPDLFEKSEKLQEVNQLLALFSDRRRYEYFCDLTEVIDSNVFKSLLDIDKQLIEEYFNRFITGCTKVDYCVANDSTPECFNVLEAKRFFNQPFTIVLENSENDGYFLDAISEAFRKQGKKFRRHYDNGWISYGNAGGCTNIINFIERQKKSFKNLPKRQEYYLRCYVLVDSDKRFSEDSSDTRKRLETYLTKNNVSWHILEKREIENYMPDEVIAEMDNNRNYYDAYLKLSEIQKDFFDLQKGFKGEQQNKLHPKVARLMENVSEEDYKHLKNGVDNKGIFKSEFPKKFEIVTREQLLKRTAHQSDPNELENIIKNITELL
ncbi:hypothetical protein [Plebeiibacterium sediminum]|uniref:Uncharacterized protein n=1 Tax=Plebeiibacterium sediminum TaxID=2992112 RepID=A0AAE3SFN0_9BACT|nr:hypothetical protein [Plebeiobacterium sediminum]MCW3787650.1 hypothetical protein [Plebeiobacterium sediminum]